MAGAVSTALKSSVALRGDAGEQEKNLFSHMGVVGFHRRLAFGTDGVLVVWSLDIQRGHEVR